MEVMPVCVLFKKRMAKKSWASSHFFVLFGKWETTPASVWNMQAYMETVSKCHGLGEWQYFLTVLPPTDNVSDHRLSPLHFFAKFFILSQNSYLTVFISIY